MRRDLKGWLNEALLHPKAESVGRIVPVEEVTDEERLAPRMSKINKTALVPLGADDVYIRGANVCNNVIDYYHSRFTERALRQVARLLPGAPMTCGHRMDNWSYGVTFDAEVAVNEAGLRARELRDVNLASWVRSLFFWPKAMSWAEDLRVAIDGGLQREVSAHWSFEKATCSVCNQDIRRCEHWPGEEYGEEGKKQRCFYEMEDVTEYLETAHVVRGGQIGTSIWGSGMEQGAASRGPLFGEAIREIKSRRDLWKEWRQMFDKQGSESAKDWFRRGLGQRSRQREGE